MVGDLCKRSQTAEGDVLETGRHSLVTICHLAQEQGGELEETSSGAPLITLSPLSVMSMRLKRKQWGIWAPRSAKSIH